MPPLNAKDLKILEALQENSQTPIKELGAKVGLPPASCWRRVHRLEQRGLISKQVVLLDSNKINVGISVFVAVKAKQNASGWFSRLKTVVDRIPEIVECYRVSGKADCFLRVVVPDIAAYDAIYMRLIEQIEFAYIRSSFAVEHVKYTTSLPMKYLSM